MKDKFSALFNARSIALIGASTNPRKWGYLTLKHLVEGGFKGRIYPVNPGEAEILGLKVYPDMGVLPEAPDMAVIVVPPQAVPSVIRQCVDKGIKAGIIITAGFAELGDQGARLQRRIVEEAGRGGMIFVGPNCNGVMSPWNRQYVQFPSFFVPPGPIAVVAQSGNVMDSLGRQVILAGQGCSVCVASGNEASLHIEDYLAYLAHDPHTRVILSYIEGFKDGERFLKIAQEVSRRKPIVMLKAGKTLAGAQAAASHTAAIAGSDAIFDAVCRQAGIIRAASLDELINMGRGLLGRNLPKGRGLGIITAGGGWGVLAADASESLGFDIVKLPESTIKELDKLLPAWWNRGNPVDLVAGVAGEKILEAIELVLQVPAVDSLMFLSIMPALKIRGFDAPVDPVKRREWGRVLQDAVIELFERLNGLADKYGKPVVVASELMWATAEEQGSIDYALGQHNAVCYHMPHQAAAVLDAMLKYRNFLNGGH